MRTSVRFAAAWLLTAGLAAFAGPPGSEKFAGTWEAKAKGTIFLVLKISAGDKISGTMKSGPVQIDEKGELVEVGPPVEDENPIFFTQVVEGGKLDFHCQDSEDNVLEFELKLTGEDSAELRIIDKEHPDLKAITVHRAKA